MLTDHPFSHSTKVVMNDYFIDLTSLIYIVVFSALKNLVINISKRYHMDTFYTTDISLSNKCCVKFLFHAVLPECPNQRMSISEEGSHLFNPDCSYFFPQNTRAGAICSHFYNIVRWEVFSCWCEGRPEDRSQKSWWWHISPIEWGRHSSNGGHSPWQYSKMHGTYSKLRAEKKSFQTDESFEVMSVCCPLLYGSECHPRKLSTLNRKNPKIFICILWPNTETISNQ